VAGTAYGSGKGRSKKEAEQQAAREAFEALAADRMVTGTGDAGTDRPGHPPGVPRTPPVEVVPATPATGAAPSDPPARVETPGTPGSPPTAG
jgi:ribosomal protein S12 methylthiotransferase accessory factor YcaO